jgi:hypothetical protein
MKEERKKLNPSSLLIAFLVKMRNRMPQEKRNLDEGVRQNASVLAHLYWASTTGATSLS